MSSYFTLPSFAKAKKNQEELQKTNPTQPLLKDEDEKFLERHLSQDDGLKPDLPPRPAQVAKVTDAGDLKDASQADVKAADGDVVVPVTQPKGSDASAEKQKWKSFELPSQDEAEATTRGWNSAVKLDEEKPGSGSAEKKTWASYLPAKLQPAKKDGSYEKDVAAEKENTKDVQGNQRTWGEYASNLVLSSSLPVWPDSWMRTKDQDAKPELVYNDDGTVNEEKTKEKQEREVSVLLDNLNMSAINNRVFAFNQETQKFYERFAQVLKDTINGVPTAYRDMDELMRDAGPTLEKQFKSMPPFVQTLVKSLPVKLGTSLEIMSAASEKPGADLKTKRAAEGSPSPTSTKPESKKKRTLPGLKKLMSKEGVVATMLRNTVNFLTIRFPFLASTTNVVLSLSVFILMFVFWYCHKRGKEVRIEKETASSSSRIIEDENDDGDFEVSSSDKEEEAVQAEQEKSLDQPDPARVPLPHTESDVNEKK